MLGSSGHWRPDCDWKTMLAPRAVSPTPAQERKNSPAFAFASSDTMRSAGRRAEFRPMHSNRIPSREAISVDKVRKITLLHVNGCSERARRNATSQGVHNLLARGAGQPNPNDERCACSFWARLLKILQRPGFRMKGGSKQSPSTNVGIGGCVSPQPPIPTLP